MRDTISCASFIKDISTLWSKNTLKKRVANHFFEAKWLEFLPHFYWLWNRKIFLLGSKKWGCFPFQPHWDTQYDSFNNFCKEKHFFRRSAPYSSSELDPCNISNKKLLTIPTFILSLNRAEWFVAWTEKSYHSAGHDQPSNLSIAKVSVMPQFHKTMRRSNVVSMYHLTEDFVLIDFVFNLTITS